MALTKISGDVIQTPLNVGVVTASRIDGDVNSTGVSTFSTLKVGSQVTVSGGIITATSFDGNVTGRINPSALNVTGVTTFAANVFHGDGDIAYFGDGNDLLIFHNSTDSIIRDDGTGDLFLQGGNKIRLTNPTGIETYAVFNQDGASELWYDNSKKFETTTSGVTVFGNITASSATISGNVSVAGTVTYEDTTNVDSIGVVTARSGLQVTGGSVGVLTSNPRATVQVGTAVSQSVFITSTGLVGLGSTAPRVSLDASQETDAIALPQGTTAQRPSGNNPYIRYNTTNSALEFYNGTDWVEIISDYFPSGSVILG